MFGLELLQLGAGALAASCCRRSRTRRQTHRCRGSGTARSDIVARLDGAAHPDGDSVDAVLLPHTLEFEPIRRRIVREADRVLTGEGQLIVLGFRR